jgi:hypothetical protein
MKGSELKGVVLSNPKDRRIGELGTELERARALLESTAKES